MILFCIPAEGYELKIHEIIRRTKRFKKSYTRHCRNLSLGPAELNIPIFESMIHDLPRSISQSKVFSDDNLKQLAAVVVYPSIDPSFEDDHLKQIIQYYSVNPEEMEHELHVYAKRLLEKGKLNEAWQVLLAVV